MFGYVRDDIKERFHTRDEVNTTRDQYVSDMVDKYINILGSTFEVPRDYQNQKTTISQQS